MPLTDTATRNFKPLEKPYKKADGGGLYLLVNPNGTKLWRLDYRFFGTRKTLAIGQYPAVSLSAARQAREVAREALARDLDPGVQKKRQKVETAKALGNTFGVVAAEFLEKLKKDGRAEPTIAKNTWMLEVLSASLYRRPITDITAADVLEVLRKVEKSGRVETALAMRATIGRVFRYAIATARAENDPTFALRGALHHHVVKSHPAITQMDEVGGLMRAVFGYEGWKSLSGALRIQALCFARPGETRTMEWAELDLKNARWTIPEAKAKMRRPHDVPLSNQALRVIEEMRDCANGGSFVFPSMMSGKKILSENSMNSALRRMGITHDQHTAHGFRSTASSLLNESKLFHPDVIEIQLAHQDKNSIRRIYNRAEHWEERQKMMQWWADFIDMKISERP